MNNMHPYFFIPATKINKIVELSKKVSNIIIDFEDGINVKDRVRLLDEVIYISNYKELWFRIPLRNEFKEKKLNFDLLLSFLELGIRKLVIPKITSKIEFSFFLSKLNNYPNLQIILLIEHPRLLIEMAQILQDNDLEKCIMGIGLGSHDLMSFMEIPHFLENLSYSRLHTIYLARAYEKFAIDIASMDIRDQEKFEKDLETGYSMGYNKKFVIHPQQLSWIHEYNQSDFSLKWAEKIIAALPEEYDGEPFILDGEIIEKPHVNKALQILKNKKNE